MLRFLTVSNRLTLCFVVFSAVLWTGCDRASQESARRLPQMGELVLRADSAVRFPHPFTIVAGLREVGSGRILISDRRELRVVLADFGSGSAVPVGREGIGPGEYAIPGRLLALAGDSTLLVDEGARRFAVIDPDGRVHTTLNPPPGVMVSRLGGIGTAGDLYFEGIPGAVASAAPDSAPILRWRRGGTQVDTVAKVRVPPLVSVTLGDPSAGSVSRMAFPQPFAPGDGWGVSPEGTLLILRSEPFQFETRDPNGTPLGVGPTLHRPSVPVTQQDKEAFALGRSAAESIPWPATKPPFGYGTLRIAPGGDAWIELFVAADDPAPLYGVLRPDGGLARLIRLPEGRRLVGLGQSSAYAAHKDADDLEWVERYAL